VIKNVASGIYFQERRNHEEARSAGLLSAFNCALDFRARLTRDYISMNNKNHTFNHTNSFKVFNILREGWQLLKGSKGGIWIAILLLTGASVCLLIINAILQFPFAILLPKHPSGLLLITYLLYSLAITIIMYAALAPFTTIPIMVAIARVDRKKLSIKIAVDCFRRWRPLAGTFVIMMLIVVIVTVLTLLTSLPLFKIISALSTNVHHYTLAEFNQVRWDKILWGFSIILFGLSIISFVLLFMMFSLPFVVDQKLSTFKAIAKSITVVAHHWFQLSLIFFLWLPIFAIVIQLPLLLINFDNELITFIGVLITMLLMVWFIPYSFMVYGICYRKLST